MVSHAHGQVDFGEDGFVARFDPDPSVVARMAEIQRHRQIPERGVWVVDAHWPSVRRLLHIASELGWHITAAARRAERVARDEGEQLEYIVDVVHDHAGDAWFLCRVGDDDALRVRVRELPGAFWDDGWWIPTDWEQCCRSLHDLVLSDPRLEVSPAAWRLLEEPDVSHLHVRSSAPLPAATTADSLEDEPAEDSPELPSKTRRRRRVALEDPGAYERALREVGERLRQLELEQDCSSPVHATRDQARLDLLRQAVAAAGPQKIASIARWIAGFVPGKEPLVVFAHDCSVLAELLVRFPDAAAVQRDDSPELRDRAVHDFAAGKSDLLICSMAHAGAVNVLTRAAQLAFADMVLEVASYARAENSVHHHGQTRDVTAWYLAADGTLDDIILRAVASGRPLDDQMHRELLQELGEAIAESAKRGRKPRVARRAGQSVASSAKRQSG